jgi:hypothetical protein
MNLKDMITQQFWDAKGIAQVIAPLAVVFGLLCRGPVSMASSWLPIGNWMGLPARRAQQFRLGHFYAILSLARTPSFSDDNVSMMRVFERP